MFTAIQRVLSNRLRGLLAWMAGAAWWLVQWLADKQFGEAIFRQVSAMLGVLPDQEWLRLVWTFGPPGLLFGLGVYFFRRAERAEATPPGATNATDQEVRELSNSNVNLRVESLTNPALVNRVETLNKRLRQFRYSEGRFADVEEAHIALLAAKLDLTLAITRRNNIEEERLRVEAASAEAKIKPLEEARAARQHSEFKTQFSNDVTEIRAELARRIGRPIGGVDDPVRDLLENGIVTDEALKALGDHLQEMADRLPS